MDVVVISVPAFRHPAILIEVLHLQIRVRPPWAAAMLVASAEGGHGFASGRLRALLRFRK